MNYIIDSDIISYYLKGNEQIKNKLIENELNNNCIFITCINYWEIKRGLLKINADRKLKDFEEFCEEFKIIFLDKIEMFDIAADIWANLSKQGNIINVSDMLVASISLYYNYTIVTNNVKHFDHVDDLKIENWI